VSSQLGLGSKSVLNVSEPTSIVLTLRKKRSSFDLVADMIESARGGAKQTAIMYRANLSYELLMEYLPLLTAKSLLEGKDENGLFHPSSKGLRYLKEYRSYGKLKDSLLNKQRLIKSYLE